MHGVSYINDDLNVNHATRKVVKSKVVYIANPELDFPFNIFWYKKWDWIPGIPWLQVCRKVEK